MEGGDQSVGNGGSRWNPTKEQINILEGLYRQGLRTPTAEHIQQITCRLQEYGHIEGKNVFYWFQNHKARQRQKQKQESFAYYNHLLNASPPVFSPYHSVPKNDAIFYQQYPKVQLPTAAATFKRSRLTPETTDQPRNQNPTWSQRYNTNPHQETLDLFPIHPTGILQSRNDHENKNPRISCTTPSMSNADNGGEEDDDENDGHYPFFDFFCGN